MTMQGALVSCLILVTLRNSIAAIVGQNVCNTRICHETANRLLQYMDPNVSPCEDFYEFACGKFIKNSVIANDQDSIGPSVTLIETVNAQLRTILEEPLKPGQPKFEQQLKIVYHLCMDEGKINARGIQPGLDMLKRAGGWPVLEDNYDRNWSSWNLLETEISLEQFLHSGGIFFILGVGKDLLDNNKIRIHLDQPSLGLEPEFLLKGPTEPVVMAYYEYMVDTAVLFGANKNIAAIKMVDCLFLEMEVAKIMRPQEDRRDFSRFYENKYAVWQLNNMIPWLNWAKVLDGMMPESVHEFTDEIVVVEPEYLVKLGKLLSQYSKEVIANYMMWRAVASMADMLSAEMGKLKFDFDTAIWGITEMKPRWEKCLLMVSSRLDLALAALYVTRFFDQNSKQRALDMVHRIREQMLPEIDDVAWMDPATKKFAKKKAAAIIRNVGYPEELANHHEVDKFYAALKMNTANLMEAIIDVNIFIKTHCWEKLVNPVIKHDWRDYGNVFVINAYYDHLGNSIEFPAAILQPPYFHADLPLYINFGTIGSIIGHETTHGFDDKGSQFNHEGNLQPWWDERSEANFNKQKQCMIDQYNGFNDTKQTMMMVNGVNSQGENIADNGGLKLAWKSYRRMFGNLAHPEPILPGLERFTHDQLFLLGMANMWCSKTRAETLKLNILTGTHAPDEFRVKGMIMNFQEFGRIFQCPLGTPMNPRQKCFVW